VIGPTGAVRVMLATKPVDFHKGAGGLAALMRETMTADPVLGPDQADLLDGTGNNHCGLVRQACRFKTE
jgi:hypothetical protein